MNSIEQKIQQLEKELAELKQEVSQNNQQTTINSVEDAFNLLKPNWWINPDGNVRTGGFVDYKFEHNESNMTSEKRAKQIKALIQLHLVAEAMNKGVGKEDDEVYYINAQMDVDWLEIDWDIAFVIPTFNSFELAEEALKKFRDLFKDLYMLND